MSDEGKLILEAIGGSQAYGMATEDSDTDYHGVFVLPTRRILSVQPFTETHVSKDPDRSHHEVGKFVRLALQANPTILEQLYLDDYVTITREGEMLCAIRQAFLSQRVRQTYGGYAIQQIHKLKTRRDQGLEGFNPRVKGRYEKHARHCFRLLWQGQQLLSEGTLNVRLSTAERNLLFEIEKLEYEPLKELFEREKEAMDAIVSPLPEKPDFRHVDDVLYDIRRMNP